MTDIMKEFIIAIKRKQHDEVLRLIRLGADINYIYKNLISQYYGMNVPPLFIAMIYSNYDICKILIENGANVNWKNIHNMSLLHLACCHTIDLPICELLIDNGADILAINTNGNRPIYYCVSYSHRYLYFKQKEAERETLNICFKRAQTDDDDKEEPEILLEENDEKTI